MRTQGSTRSHPRHLTALAVALVGSALVLPSVGATWYGPGTAEPDTPHDEAKYMFPDPDASADGRGRVYLNGYQAAPGTSANPNVGATGSTVLTAPAAHHRVLLGVWKDCNNDGYIGAAESGVQDYLSALLVDASVCPATTYTDTPVHNDGLWVREMLTIGMVDPCEFKDDDARPSGCARFAINERVIYDNATYVWADHGAPGAAPRGWCAIAPLTPGATDGTGAFIAYADCQSQRGIARTVNALDADGTLGVRFEDEQHPETSSSILNQRVPVSLFGYGAHPGVLEADAPPAATAWDCDAPRGGADVRDPTGGALPSEAKVEDPSGGRLTGPQFPLVIVGIYFVDHDGDPSTPGVIGAPLTDADGSYAWVPTPAPALHDARGSWWSAGAHVADGPNGDCDAASGSPIDDAYAGHAVEAPAAAPRGPKTQTDMVFTFFDGHRGFSPNADPHTGATTPSDGGILYLDHDHGGDGPMWSATRQVEQDAQLLSRSDLQPAGAAWFTYYASVSSLVATTYELPPGGTTAYGSEACGGTFAGESGAWACDAGAWWIGANGEDLMPRFIEGAPYGRAPGDAYQLRDVDCYDGTLVRGVPPRASLADISQDGACPTLEVR